MTLGAEDHLLAMFDRVAENFGTQIKLYVPTFGAARSTTLGTREASSSFTLVSAVRGAWNQAMGRYGRAAANVEEGVYTVRADATGGKPNDAWWVVESNTSVRQEVVSVDEVCGGLFYVIRARKGTAAE